jgi:hypothetical protein
MLTAAGRLLFLERPLKLSRFFGLGRSGPTLEKFYPGVQYPDGALLKCRIGDHLVVTPLVPRQSAKGFL